MSYLVDRRTQILVKTASFVYHNGKRRAIIADPRAEFVVVALAGGKVRYPVPWYKIYQAGAASGISDQQRSQNKVLPHVILCTASCVTHTGKPRPIIAEPRSQDVMVALAGLAAKKYTISWKRIYLLGQRLHAANIRLEKIAAQAYPKNEKRIIVR